MIPIDREFFFEIGTFDMDMSIWGGENTELSLRVREYRIDLWTFPVSKISGTLNFELKSF